MALMPSPPPQRPPLDEKEGALRQVVQDLQGTFAALLDLDCHPAADTSFFNLGGSSLLASQLAHRIRKKHAIPFSGAEVFHHSTCADLARLIRERQQQQPQQQARALSPISPPRSAAGSPVTASIGTGSAGNVHGVVAGIGSAGGGIMTMGRNFSNGSAAAAAANAARSASSPISSSSSSPRGMGSMSPALGSGSANMGRGVGAGADGASGGGIHSDNGTATMSDSDVMSESNGSSSGALKSSIHSFHQNVDTQGSPFTAERLQPEDGWLATIVQLIPLLVIYPLFQVTRFFLFFVILLAVLRARDVDLRNITTFVITLIIFHAIWVTVAPLVFVIIKWIVIGRYRAGRYPIWGNYYLRWWIVDYCRKLFGKGIWGSNDMLQRVYYRMLGANVGRDARFSVQATIAEYDLVTIGDEAGIEYATVRAFGVDNGAMILGPVAVGHQATVGWRSVVAPYTCVPNQGQLAPGTASYEVGPALEFKHARVNRKSIPSPNVYWQLFVGGPITFLVELLAHVPSLAILYWMIQSRSRSDAVFVSLSAMMEWLCAPERIPFYIAIRLARGLVGPFIYIILALLVKWTVVGRFEPGPWDTSSQWQRMRHWLVAAMFCRENMQQVTELLGRHYELVSVLYRICGAKIGKRVYWPGVQPIFSGHFELLEVGDDVVFGSRSALLCQSVDTCERIRLCAGSNVADNCLVLPGATVGKNAVLGSNSVCPEGRFLPESSVWFGTRGGEPVMLEKGDVAKLNLDRDQPQKQQQQQQQQQQQVLYTAQVEKSRHNEPFPMEGDESTLRPYGKAFYKDEATYWVMPLPLIILYTLLTRVFIAAFHVMPILTAIHGAAAYLWGLNPADRDYSGNWYSSWTVYSAILTLFCCSNLARVLLWAAIELGVKWMLLGRREEGRYNWDTSSYAQRWEMYNIATEIRSFGGNNSVLDFLCGTPFFVAYFRAMGAIIGRSCCLFPAGADPIMTEPDLVEMGHECVADSSSIVAHLNTRGNFELIKIRMESHCTLRCRSRIQQGVYMEAGSMLLEKGLVMTGEVMESDSVWQGAPASRIFSYPPQMSLLPSTSYRGSVATDEEDGVVPMTTTTTTTTTNNTLGGGRGTGTGTGTGTSGGATSVSDGYSRSMSDDVAFL